MERKTKVLPGLTSRRPLVPFPPDPGCSPCTETDLPRAVPNLPPFPVLLQLLLLAFQPLCRALEDRAARRFPEKTYGHETRPSWSRVQRLPKPRQVIGVTFQG